MCIYIIYKLLGKCVFLNCRTYIRQKKIVFNLQLVLFKTKSILVNKDAKVIQKKTAED